MKSKIIVIEGLDGSGKATQTKILYEKISALGKKVTKLEFPNYESPAAAPVTILTVNSATSPMMSMPMRRVRFMRLTVLLAIFSFGKRNVTTAV